MQRRKKANCVCVWHPYAATPKANMGITASAPVEWKGPPQEDLPWILAIRDCDVLDWKKQGRGLEEEARTGEVKDGVTAPMRNARQRVYRQPIDVSKSTVEVVEQALFQVLDGKGPAGYVYKDYEEVWDGEKWVQC